MEDIINCARTLVDCSYTELTRLMLYIIEHRKDEFSEKLRLSKALYECLQKAALSGDTPLLKRFMTACPSFFKGERGTQVAVSAVSSGSIPCVKALFDGGVSVNPVCGSALTNLVNIAMENTDDAMFDFLCSMGANVLSLDSGSGISPIHFGCTHMLEVLCKVCGPDFKDCRGRTPAVHASRSGNTDALRILFNHGADINERDRHGWSPLHFASFRGHFDAVKLIVELNTHTAVYTNSGETPVHGAALRGCARCIRILVRAGIPLDARSNALAGVSGRSALSMAAGSGHLEAVVELLALGATTVPDVRQRTPLHYAAEGGHTDVVRVLKNICDVHAEDASGETALFKVLRCEDSGAKRTLYELATLCKGRNVKNASGRTSMHVASYNGFFEFINILNKMNIGCVHSTDVDGRLPFDLAFWCPKPCSQHVLHALAKSGCPKVGCGSSDLSI